MLRRNCSKGTDFKREADLLHSRLKQRGYSILKRAYAQALGKKK